MEPEGQLNINLFNFDDIRFEDSKYVLTSPRSLEACSRLNIKPVEILTRPLEDFRDELLPRGLTVRSIFEIYNEYERERQNKLQLCVEERWHIIAEEAARSDDGCQDASGSLPTPTFVASAYLKQMDSHPKNDREHKSQKNQKSSLEKSLFSKRDQSRQTQTHSHEFDARLDKITHNARQKLNGILREPTKIVKNPDKKKRPCFKQSQSDLGYGSEHDAYSETGSVASSLMSARSCISDVTFVTDPLLKKKLHGSLNSQTRLRTKDQKILSVLLRKKELEKETSIRREHYHHQWEEEWKREHQERELKDNQRRLDLAKKKKVPTATLR